MMGNVGQSNYTAANIQLDMFARHGRLCMAATDWTTLMWGAVGNLGMRWKAFGSQDMLQSIDGGSTLFTIPDAQKILRVMAVLVEPNECTAASLFDTATLAAIMGKTSEAGRGHESATDAQVEAPEKTKPETFATPAAVSPATAVRELVIGDRVRLHSLVTNAEMNGATGVLKRRMATGKWQVRFDNSSYKDKLMDQRLLELVNSTPASNLAQRIG